MDSSSLGLTRKIILFLLPTRAMKRLRLLVVQKTRELDTSHLGNNFTPGSEKSNGKRYPYTPGPKQKDRPKPIGNSCRVKIRGKSEYYSQNSIPGLL